MESIEHYKKHLDQFVSFEGICWWLIDYENDPEYFHCNEQMVDLFSLDKTLEKHSVNVTCPIAGDYNKNIPDDETHVNKARIVFDDYQKLITSQIDEYHNVFPYYNAELGKKFYFSSRAKVLERNEKGEIRFLYGVIEDITLYEQQRLEIERLSQTDVLTDLYNRMKIDEVLKSEVQRAQRTNGIFSVVILDLDHFKHINDTYGHLVGDSVLQKTAKVLKKHIRKIDSVGRWGGEEFLIICPDTTADGARVVAEKLRKALEHIDFLNQKGQITASFGIAQYSQNEGLISMMSQADSMLYQAKALGRNRVEVYHPNL